MLVMLLYKGLYQFVIWRASIKTLFYKELIDRSHSSITVIVSMTTSNNNKDIYLCQTSEKAGGGRCMMCKWVGVLCTQ